MKVGFTLKAKKRPTTSGVGVGFRVEKEEKAVDKDIVLGFGTSGKALLKNPVAANAPLVIPLIEQNWSKQGASEADQEAAAALLADIQLTTGDETKYESSLVIPVDAKTEKDAPILFRNKVPGADGMTNENDKFKHDISHRPDDMDIHSEAYEAVPIEEFGAALLRGMGWSGKDRVKATGSKVQMRHQRLGLGATPRPPMEGDNKKKKRPNMLDIKPIRLIEKKSSDSKPNDEKEERSSRRDRESNRSSRRDEEQRRSRSRDRRKRSDSRDRRNRSRSRDRRYR
ncbi:hypothetical protein THRCLA_08870 [Thraustotheca clavata]|uniref:Spp2/MOS2 G-patch domain-containing protein n=1 Tax=Thraustotheca clavata TaxID=74557 RepID=A0A1V9Z1I1_9STRA|nr:hypothetical protein THRCLA_08870 [Thraustotheca clavata]